MTDPFTTAIREGAERTRLPGKQGRSVVAATAPVGYCRGRRGVPTPNRAVAEKTPVAPDLVRTSEGNVEAMKARKARYGRWNSR